MTKTLTLKKEKGMKDPTDYRPARNFCPVKTLQRDDDALGPSELDWTTFCVFIIQTCN